MAVPFRTTVTNARAAYRVRESVLIVVETGGGQHGIGEASLPAGASIAAHGTAIDVFMAAAAESAIGRGDGDGFAHLRLPSFVPGEWSAATACGLETALADLAARAAGLPLYRWLAGVAGVALPHGDQEVEANGLVDLVDPAAAAATAINLVRDGFRTLKLKVGTDPEASAATVAAVRAAGGPAGELRCDANRSWSPDEARAFLAGCAGHAVALCEEPLADPGAAYRAMATLRAASPVALAVDESARTAEALELVIASFAADAVVIKPMASGLAEALAMLTRAGAAGLTTVVTTTFDLAPGTALAMHLAALVASPRPACGLATADLVEDLLGHGVPDVRHGALRLSEAPGLAVELDHEAIERYATGPWEGAAA